MILVNKQAIDKWNRDRSIIYENLKITKVTPQINMDRIDCFNG